MQARMTANIAGRWRCAGRGGLTLLNSASSAVSFSRYSSGAFSRPPYSSSRLSRCHPHCSPPNAHNRAAAAAANRYVLQQLGLVVGAQNHHLHKQSKPIQTTVSHTQHTPWRRSPGPATAATNAAAHEGRWPPRRRPTLMMLQM